ncbi:hypothetical protein [Campylobacter sputorum]|nr:MULTISPECIES: hypothetical protein [Campylobacter]
MQFNYNFVAKSNFTTRSVFGADGATIFKKCIACHGTKAEAI